VPNSVGFHGSVPPILGQGPCIDRGSPRWRRANMKGASASSCLGPRPYPRSCWRRSFDPRLDQALSTVGAASGCVVEQPTGVARPGSAGARGHGARLRSHSSSPVPGILNRQPDRPLICPSARSRFEARANRRETGGQGRPRAASAIDGSRPIPRRGRRRHGEGCAGPGFAREGAPEHAT